MFRQAGVTVLEVVVSLLIIVLIIGIAAPTIQQNRRDGRMVLYALTPAGRALFDAVLGEVPA